MNKVFIVGTLGQVKMIQGQVNTAFVRVVTKKMWQGKEMVNSFSVTAFKELADKVVNYKDNDLVSIEGYLKNSKFNKDGKDQYKLDVICTAIERLVGNDSSGVVVEDIPF